MKIKNVTNFELNKPEVWVVIPARYASTRFPGKPLAMIAGKTMIERVIRGVLESRLIDKIIVATDDERIFNAVQALPFQNFKVESVMTASDLASGSDRVWAAVKNKNVDIVINVQGDEPLISGNQIDLLIQPMLQDLNLEMATLAHPISLEEMKSENSVKVIVNQESNAIYFSRFPIPFSRKNITEPIKYVYKHIGMYGYRTSFLKKYCESSTAFIEESESLEQLRALYLGAKIKVIHTEQRSWGVDIEQDISVVEKLLLEKQEQK